VTARDVVCEALGALAAHRLRATLSSMGIVGGVATVVTALAIGEGARRAAISEISALGINNILVRAVDGEREGRGQNDDPEAPTLTVADAEAIAATVDGLSATAALRLTRTDVGSGGRSIVTTAVGASESWDRIVGARPGLGRWLDAVDIGERRRVAVLGAELARALFGSANPVGEYVHAAGNNFRVVGVLAETGSAAAARSTVGAVDLDAAIIVPLTAMDARLGRGDTLDNASEIAASAGRADDVIGVAAVIERVLQERRHDPSRYEIVVPRALLQARLRAQRTFNGVLLGVGGLALLISGVGIMNIMLASVAERTHEIGVRRALGAREKEVVAQFAVEASLLCVAGGVLGIPLGAAQSGIVAWLAHWPISISLSSVGLALALSAGVGLLFGIYPAKVAARLDPVAALRAE